MGACIIKKSIVQSDGSTKSTKIYHDSVCFPFRVSEVPGDDIELKAWLLSHCGPGKYYVYMMGGPTTYRKYFNGVVSY